jgi:hypothetical protein
MLGNPRGWLAARLNFSRKSTSSFSEEKEAKRLLFLVLFP